MRRKTRIVVLFVITIVFSTKPALAQSFKELVESGESELARQQYDRAIGTFEEALAVANQAEIERDVAHSLFYLALVRQRQAEAAEDPQRAEQFRTEAITLYERSINLEPTGGALNNLAMILRTYDGDIRVSELFERAISLDPQRAALYATNYAEFLEDQGDFRSAADYYRRAAVLRPQDESLQQAVVDLLSRYFPSEHDTLNHLWELAEAGQPNLALDEALQLADTPKFRGLSELMAIVAFALSKLDHDSKTLAQSPAGEHLRSLAEAGHDAARELLQLFEAQELEPANFTWWSERGGPPEPQSAHFTPLEALRLLARSLGYRAEARDDLALAEQYYELAATLSREEVDPASFVDLANLYIKSNRPEDLKSAVGRFEPLLYRGKGLAYQRHAWKEIYDYHRALGLMYGYLQIWESSPGEPYSNTLFQLENAERAAQRANEGDTWRRYGLEEPIAPDPQLKLLLSEAYAQAAQHGKSVDARLDAAEIYLKDGDTRSAAETIEPLRDALPADTSPTDRQRFFDIQGRVPATDKLIETWPGQTVETWEAQSRGWPFVTAATASASRRDPAMTIHIDFDKPPTLQAGPATRQEIERIVRLLLQGDSSEDSSVSAAPALENLLIRLERFGVVDITGVGTEGWLIFEQGKERIAVPIEFRQTERR